MAVFRSGESWCGRWRTGIDNDLESRLLGGSTLQSVVLCRPSTADERDKPLGFLSRPSATHFGSDSTRLNIAKVSKFPCAFFLHPPHCRLPRLSWKFLARSCAHDAVPLRRLTATTISTAELRA